VTSGVHGIAARRAARQRTTLADGPDLSIKTLGSARIKSPLTALLDARQTTEHYVDEGDRVLLDDTLSMVRARGGSVGDLPSFEPAGPRRKIFFDPSKTRAGIVTCGGLCPGLNDVIRSLVRNLTYHYGCGASSASATATRVSSPPTATSWWI
jgi:6-phosphofructokinase 1